MGIGCPVFLWLTRHSQRYTLAQFEDSRKGKRSWRIEPPASGIGAGSIASRKREIEAVWIGGLIPPLGHEVEMGAG